VKIRHFRTWFSGGLASVRFALDLIILKVFSNLNDSMIIFVPTARLCRILLKIRVLEIRYRCFFKKLISNK